MAETILLPGEKPVPAASSAEVAEPAGQWSLGRRIAFRLCFCYLLPFGATGLFIYAFFMDFFLPLPIWKDMQRFEPWTNAMPWICAHIFRVQRKLAIFPDSDFLSGYLQHLIELMLALIATVVWSILDRKRTNYRRLYAWFALVLRFSLAIVLFSYGFDKIFPLQFRPVTPGRLSQQVGDLDMFNMLWIFMASSKPYTIFSGAMEVLAGLLLLTPRLETAGALLAVPVLTNVFLLNMDYGVPVKMISSHLLLVAVFLAAPALPGMVQLLVLRQPVTPVVPEPLSSRRSVDWAARICVGALGVFMAIIACIGADRRYDEGRAAAAAAQRTPFFGLWLADAFTVPSAGPQSLFTDKLQQEYGVGPGTDHWLALAIEEPKRMTIDLGGGVQDGVDLALDPSTGIAQVSDSDDPAWKARLTFQTPGNGRLTIEGTVNGVPISSSWHRKELSDFRLVKDKFQWIQPDPE